MAKLSSIEKNKRRAAMASKHRARRQKYKDVIANVNSSQAERFEAAIKLAQLPRNGSITRVRNRCELTGRPRGVYRKFRLARTALRRLASLGLIPGLTKASW
jgi:small subunit ribosomal protein S14